MDQHSVGVMRLCTLSPPLYFYRAAPSISSMKLGMSTHRLRIVRSGNAGLAADARVTQRVVSTMMGTHVYGDLTICDR